MGKAQFGFEILVRVHTRTGRIEFQYNKNHAKSSEIHFTVPFSSNSEKHIAEITLFNINPGHFNSIRQGDKVELFAGYHGDTGLLLSGTIFRTTTPTLQDADTAYVLRVLEGQDYTRLPKQNITFAAGTYADVIIKEVARRSGMQLDFVSINKNKRFEEEYTAEGHPMEILSSLATETKTSLFYLRGRLTFAFVFAF